MRSRRISAPFPPSSARASALAELTRVIAVSAAASKAAAAINRTNELNAQNLLGISNTAYNNLWQYYGDTMEWAWTSAENERSRVIELAKAQLQADSATNIQNLK